MQPVNYPCAQSELYGTARTGWVSYAEFLTAFEETRGYYNAAYGIAAKAAVNTAAALPDNQARNGITEGYRIELTHLADTSLARWQMLKRLSTTSFPADMLKPRLEQAGSDYYAQAAAYNWDKLSSLNDSAKNFMVSYHTELSAGDNMPASFPTDYEADMDAFEAKLEQFISSEETGKVETAAKITANNAVYNTLINMFKDGQEIFDDNEEVKDQFIFAKVLELYRGHGQAGVRGLVTDASTMQALLNVEVMILISSESVMTDADGKYILKPLATGYYDIRFVCPGYHDIVINQFHIIMGTVSTLDVMLVPIV